MNSYLAKTIVVMLIVATMLGLTSCAREEPNVGNSAVVNNANSSASNSGIRVAEKDCDFTDIGERRREVHKKIESKIRGKDGEKGLKVQYEKGGFELITEVNDPVDPNSYLVVYVFGRIHGTDELEEFANLINDFNKDKGCVSRVVFLPKESRGSFRTDPGFEWTYCPYDIQPCPDGSCGCRFIPKSGDTPTSNSNQRNNMNSMNSTVNSSSNASP